MTAARLGFELHEDPSLIDPKLVETEKVLDGLICALRGSGAA